MDKALRRLRKRWKMLERRLNTERNKLNPREPKFADKLERFLVLLNNEIDGFLETAVSVEGAQELVDTARTMQQYRSNEFNYLLGPERSAVSPEFEFFGKNDLPRGLRQKAQYYQDGQLRQVRFGRESWLRLEHGRPAGRCENPGSVSQYHENGVVEEYGGRYERAGAAQIGFGDWVRQQLGVDRNAWAAPQRAAEPE